MKKLARWASLFLAVALLWSISSLGVAAAQEPAARSLSISCIYTNIQSNKGEEISLPLTIANTGKQGENVVLDIVSGPVADWGATFRDRGFTIRGIFLAADGTRDINFAAKSPSDAKAGDYTFVLKATTQDGKVSSTFSLTIGLAERVTSGLGASLSSDYPVLEGEAGTSFVFNVNLKNNTDKDLNFDLVAKAPQGWDVSVSPSFESGKLISTTAVQSSTTKSLDVTVRSPSDAAPDTYPISFRASSGNLGDTIQLKATVTGKFGLILTTANSRFNTDATLRKDSFFSIQLFNSGSAPLQDVSLSSDKPDGWVITFEPDRLQSLAPGSTSDVTVRIRPADNAIAGDYIVSLRALANKASDTEDFRITVKSSTIWGLVGIGIVVLVILGLVAIFIRTGRR